MLKIDNEFIELNKNFVYSIVNKYANNDNRDDLYQVGMLAVVKAGEMYDPKKGVKFSTFAYKHILGEILKFLRENKNIKPSRDMIKLYKQIIRIKEHFYTTEGRKISAKELASILNIPEVKIYEIESACAKIESLDADLNEDFSLKDIISKEEQIDKNDIIELKDALKKLNLEERNFIYERYYENKTQTEIAEEKKVNQVKIYRYERSLLNRLKDEMVA